tara:strand:+ start:521 stop:700 length:180 start_codon:yes stop_codon:yes gene_type:complete
MLSRKHYKAIASIIKDNTLNDDVLNESYIDKEAFINDLTSYFNSDNNRFSWERFVEACD